MSHSTNSGFSRRREVRSDGKDSLPPIPLRGAWRPSREFVDTFSDGDAPSFQSRVVGVAQNPAAADDDRSSDNKPAAFTAPRSTFRFHASEPGDVGARLGSPSRADAVGQNEESLASVRRADFRRCKQSRRNAVTHVDQVSGDHVEPKPQMPGDVLEETDSRLTLGDDSSDVGPQVAGIVLAASLAGDAKRLARITAMYDINESAPRLRIKLLEIAPYRSSLNDSVLHPGEENVLRELLDFDVADGAVLRDGESEAEVDASDAGAEAEAIQLSSPLLAPDRHRLRDADAGNLPAVEPRIRANETEEREHH